MAWHGVALAAEASARFMEGISPGAGAAAAGGLPAAASGVAAEAFSILAGFFPFYGPAARNFGTALRVEAVRAKLKGCRMRDEPLLRVLEWVAAAADSFRHLTAPAIQDALAAFSGTLAGPSLPVLRLPRSPRGRAPGRMARAAEQTH